MKYKQEIVKAKNISYAFKKPVICTDVGSVTEVVDNNKTGIIIQPNNPKLLAEKVIELMKNDKKRVHIGTEGYRKMKNFLNWDHQTKILVKEYKKTLQKSKNEK